MTQSSEASYHFIGYLGDFLRFPTPEFSVAVSRADPFLRCLIPALRACSRLTSCTSRCCLWSRHSSPSVSERSRSRHPRRPSSGILPRFLGCVESLRFVSTGILFCDFARSLREVCAFSSWPFKFTMRSSVLKMWLVDWYSHPQSPKTTPNIPRLSPHKVAL